MKGFVRIGNFQAYFSGGRANCNLYNSKGGLYIVKGAAASDKCRRVELYVRREDSLEPEPCGVIPAESRLPNPEAPEPAGDEIPGYGEREIPKETVAAYKEAVSGLAEAFFGGLSGKEVLRRFNEISERTFLIDKSDLYICGRFFPSFDRVTARHSVSVFCLFCDVMLEIKNGPKNDEFWTLFKSKGANVNFSAGQLKKYALGALMHDVGKIEIPNEILEKKTPLNQEERELLRRHAKFGVEILDRVEEDSPEIRLMVGNHHPAYPVFPDVEMSPLVQILSMVDIFDACRTERPYKPALPFDVCVEILKKEQEIYGWNRNLLNFVVDRTLRKFELRYRILAAPGFSSAR